MRERENRENTKNEKWATTKEIDIHANDNDESSQFMMEIDKVVANGKWLVMLTKLTILIIAAATAQYVLFGSYSHSHTT